MNQVKKRQPRNSNEVNESIKKHSLLLPYLVEKGSTIIKTLSKELRRIPKKNQNGSNLCGYKSRILI